MDKAHNVLFEIAQQIPGMGCLQIDCEGTFKDEADLIWDWFRVAIAEPMNLKSGTLLYIYADSVDFELKTKPDYELVNEDGDEINLYWI